MGLDELLKVMDSLREKCPWDKKQTRDSLKPFLVEECYESMEAIIEGISRKMVRRHPHVFGSAEYKTAEEVKSHWEEHKKAEGKHKESVLEGVPKSMPSL